MKKIICIIVMSIVFSCLLGCDEEPMPVYVQEEENKDAANDEMIDSKSEDSENIETNEGEGSSGNEENAREEIGFPLKLDRIYSVSTLGFYNNQSLHEGYITALSDGYNWGYVNDYEQHHNPTYLIDISGAEEGDEIYAVADGTVAYVGNTPDGGYMAVIRHEEQNTTTYSYYGHMQGMAKVVKDQEVEKGVTVIGNVGHTGKKCFGTHLHFEWYGHDPYCEYLEMGYIHEYTGKGNNHKDAHDTFGFVSKEEEGEEKSVYAYVSDYSGDTVLVDELELVWPRTERAKELGLAQDETLDVADIYNPENTYIQYKISPKCTFVIIDFSTEEMIRETSGNEFFDEYGSFGGVVMLDLKGDKIVKVTEIYFP